MAAIKFSSSMNLFLLREVVSVNPYSYARKRLLKLSTEDKPWEKVAYNLRQLPEFASKKVTARTCQEHTKLVICQWKLDDRRAFKGTGTDDEEVNELKQLANEVNQLIETGVEELPEPEKENEGANVRNAALETLAETRKRKEAESDRDVEPNKRVSKAGMLSFMQARAEMEKDVRERELDLRKEALDLERKRLELQEKKDNEQAAERRMFMEFIMRNK